MGRKGIETLVGFFVLLGIAAMVFLALRAANLGTLRDHDSDFKAIWFGDKIKEVRRSIAAKECYCPLANASYTNMLIDPPTLTRVGLKVISPE